jgi:hypothetical protein
LLCHQRRLGGSEVANSITLICATDRSQFEERMARLIVAALGDSIQDRAQARGKLFEQLVATILRSSGFRIDRTPNINYAGMELDIEGTSPITELPFYAECTCRDTEIDSPKFQSFFGKFTARWLRDNRYQGIFIALPGLNQHAKGFYREYCESRKEMTVRLIEETEIVGLLSQSSGLTDARMRQLVPGQAGTPGETSFLYSDRGIFGVVNVIAPGGTVPTAILFLHQSGIPVTEKESLEYLDRLCPEFREFQKTLISEPLSSSGREAPREEIVQLRGSSAPLEYQFPASPAHFVGRDSLLDRIQSFVQEVIAGSTSSRGILVEANSGWGKSSLVLAVADRIRRSGSLAIAIDSRSASTSQFILRVVDYVDQAIQEGGSESEVRRERPPLTGFDDAMRRLESIDRLLKEQQRVLVIFLDQFENLFFMPDSLRRIRDMLFKLCDSQSNVLLGFSWKSDLVGVTSEFPFQLRDDVAGQCSRFTLEPFSIDESERLLSKLAAELKAPLRKDLAFLLLEYSQGFPWLLKKLCAHVVGQRNAGHTQAEIASGLLNVDQLFLGDLKGLTAEAEDTLRQVARIAPISVSELAERVKPEIVQSLVNERFLIRIGGKLDIYWDIFRDFLNNGTLPVQENYILRQQIITIFRAVRILAEAQGRMEVEEFQTRSSLKSGSYYNVVRDMKLVGLISIESGVICLSADLGTEPATLEAAFRAHLRERLPLNRIAAALLSKLESARPLPLSDAADHLAQMCPYVSATPGSWRAYAGIMADWLDAVDLAVFDHGNIYSLEQGTRLRDRRVLTVRRRVGLPVPGIHCRPLERIAIQIEESARTGRPLNLSGLSPSSPSKAIRALEDLGFISRRGSSILIDPSLTEFVRHPELRSHIFAEKALRIKSFSTFIAILREPGAADRSFTELASVLKQRLAADWKPSSAKVIASIMLNWARYAELVPKGRKTATRRLEDVEMRLH